MNKEIQRLLGEAKNKMNGYVALLSFRYSNLCVKADPVALLPVLVIIDGEEKNIEEVAEVSIPKDDVLAVVPKDSELLFDIGKGVKKAHPEFKMDLVQKEGSDDEDDKYLTFTMPKVDKDRHDLLEEGVDGLHDQCKARVDLVLEQYGVKIAKAMEGADIESIDYIKNQLQELHKFFDDLMEKLTKGKKQEIEDAYQLYLAEQQQKEQEAQEQDAAHGSGMGMSMKIDDLLNNG
jgi:ribosome recycling factor